MTAKTLPSVCNLCEAICGLRVTVADGAITRIEGDPEDPLSRGHICPKGVALADIYADPDRLRQPLVRVGAEWQEIGWAEAFELAGRRLAEISRRDGRDSVGVYLGNPNAHCLGSMTHGLAFVKLLRTRNLFSASSVDQLPHQLVASRMFGHQLLLPIPDLDRTDLFLVLGGNPLASNGSLMTAPDIGNRVRDLRRRGGRLVVLDPRRTETAKAADAHHFVRPGTDVFVVLAMIHLLLADGATLPAYVADHEAAANELAAAVAEWTPARAAAISGLTEPAIVELAREFAAAPRAVAYARLGVSANAHGTLGVWAVNVLNLITGNLDREGGAMFTSPLIDITGTMPVTSASGPKWLRATKRRGLVGPGHHGLWRSRVRGAPETANELPAAVMAEEIETPGRGQIRALVTIAGNPVLSTPDGARLDRALSGLEFMVAVDFYLNETTRHADLILPPASHLERDHYDLVFNALAVRNTARFSPAVFQAPPQARQDWQIFGALARSFARHARLGRRARLQLSARMALSPTRMLALLLRGSGRKVTLADLRAAPSGIDLGPLQPGQLPDRLLSGSVDLIPDLIADALAELKEPTPAEPGSLLLIGRRALQDCNSWLHNSPRLTKGRARHQLLIHPDDLATRGLADGEVVRVGSAVGEVLVEARASDDLMPGVVSLPHGYGHGRAGTRLRIADGVAGVSINDLTDPSRLDVSGNAALNGVPVQVTAPD